MASKLWQEFKAFAFKGNMIDLAIAVVIGAAFTGVINSLVQDIVMPGLTDIIVAVKSGAQTAETVAVKTASVVGVTTKPSTQPSTEPSSAQAAPPPPPPPAPAAAPPASPSDLKVVDLTWTIKGIRIGNFLGQLLNFLLVAFAVFITMVKLLGSVVKKVGGEATPSEPTSKECPKCLSVIPIKATKCAFCTADLP